MIAAVRTSFGIRRFEILGLLTISAAVTIVALTLGAMLRDLPQPLDCTLDAGPQDAGCPSAQAFIELSQGAGATLIVAVGALPFIVGAVLGVTVVGREIEARTAPFAWSFQPARIRWLAETVAILGLLTVLMIAVLAVSSSTLQAARYPTVAPGSSFFDYGHSGLILIARSLLAMSIGIMAGAIIGRVLPALLLAAALSSVLYLVLPAVGLVGRPLEVVSETDVNRGALYVDSGYLTASGEMLRPPEAFARAPVGMDVADQADWVESEFTFVRLGLPGEQLGAVLAQEALVSALIIVLALAGSAAVVDRRRPY